jgi:hypothetical protein
MKQPTTEYDPNVAILSYVQRKDEPPMSASLCLGSAYISAMVPGTVRLIFSGHDGSASGDNSMIMKLIGQLKLVHPSVD